MTINKIKPFYVIYKIEKYAWQLLGVTSSERRHNWSSEAKTVEEAFRTL